MNTTVQYCLLIIFFVLLGEYIEISEAYKVPRLYKYYQRKPWPYRPRWHSYPRLSKYHRYKRLPPKDYSFHRGEHYRYRHSDEDFANRPTDAHPYTIVIQLPNRDEKHDRRLYQRHYDRESIPMYVREDDYIEEEEDIDTRQFYTNNKKVRVKVTKGGNPKLHIKISRVDAENNIEIIDKSNITAMNIPLQPTIYTNLTLSMQPSVGNLIPSTAATFHLEKLRRK